MSNRWLRFVIALVAIAAIGAAGYRIFQREQQLGRETAALDLGEGWARTAVESVGEIKAALHAYVAPGQGQPFWTARAAVLLDKLRGALLELDRVASSHGAPLTETLDLSDRLGASEQRARDHVRAGQSLLAGEVVFTEARDLLDAIRVQVARARDTLAQTRQASHAVTRREQMLLVVGAGAIAALALLILVPPGRPDEPVGRLVTSLDERPPQVESQEEYARVIPTPRDAASSAAPRSTAVAATSVHVRPPITKSGASALGTLAPSTAAPSTAASSTTAPSPPAPGTSAPGTSAPGTSAPGTSAPGTSAPPHTRTPAPSSWPDAARLCTDIARVSDSQEISVLLGRAAALLKASGIVLWMASETGEELVPAATTGYDDRMVARLGAISRDSTNLTAGAFRDGAAQTSAGRRGAAAALAVPLVAPQGAVGVLSAELPEIAEVDPEQLAIATILAAQLSMLLGSIPATETETHGAASL